MEPKRGGGPKRKKEQIPVDQNFIMPLFLKGKGFNDIAAILAPLREYRVDYQTVYTDVQKVLKQWQEERMSMIDQQMNIDLKKIDQLEAVYWESWEKSKQAKVKTVQKEKSVFDKKNQKRLGDLTAQEAQRHVTEYVGDKQWLDGVQWCIMQRAELLRYKHVKPAGVDDVIPVAFDVVFTTRSRKNDHIQEAIEIHENNPPEDGIRLLTA